MGEEEATGMLSSPLCPEGLQLAVFYSRKGTVWTFIWLNPSLPIMAVHVFKTKMKNKDLYLLMYVSGPSCREDVSPRTCI